MLPAPNHRVSHISSHLRLASPRNRALSPGTPPQPSIPAPNLCWFRSTSSGASTSPPTLQPSDFILREDGHPRPFTVFEGPRTENPLPLELILLFDTTPKAPGEHRLNWFPWDPQTDYEFLDNWDETTTREVLPKERAK